MQQLQGHSITYRIAMGPQAGRKVLTTCAARYKRFLPGERMTMATISLLSVDAVKLASDLAERERLNSEFAQHLDAIYAGWEGMKTKVIWGD